jgi:hypothetical protein
VAQALGPDLFITNRQHLLRLKKEFSGPQTSSSEYQASGGYPIVMALGQIHGLLSSLRVHDH